MKREKFKPLAGPDGGNGGHGGDIVLVADPQVTTLLSYHHSPRPDVVPLQAQLDPALAANAAPLSREEVARLAEKFREDWIRGRSQWKFARWGAKHLANDLTNLMRDEQIAALPDRWWNRAARLASSEMRGSSAEDHALRTISICSAGSQRVVTAHITSARFEGSTSSSTTTTSRPM